MTTLRSSMMSMSSTYKVLEEGSGLNNTSSLGPSNPIPEEAQGDPDALVELIAKDPALLRWVDEETKADQDFLESVLERNWHAAQYMPEEMKNDSSWGVSLCRKDGRLLRHLSTALRADSDVVMAAVRNYGLALQHASDALRSDCEVVIFAVKNNGLALQFAAPELRDDQQVVTEAVLNNPRAFKFASARLHRNSTVMALQKFDPNDFRQSTNEQAPPPEIFQSPEGWVEYRRPRYWCWPVVYCCAHGGTMRPHYVPDRTSVPLKIHPELDALAEELWNESGKGRLAAATLVWCKLDPDKIDVDAPRSACCDDGNPALLEAWDAYHNWIEEALQLCVEQFGFALLLDIHDQKHRRLVTELGYGMDLDELLLFDDVLDVSTRPTSVDYMLRGRTEPDHKRPGGLAALIRGRSSLGGCIERHRFRCTPSPTTPEPVQAQPLYRSRKKAQTTALSEEELNSLKYLHNGFTLRRYSGLATEEEEKEDQEHRAMVAEMERQRVLEDQARREESRGADETVVEKDEDVLERQKSKQEARLNWKGKVAAIRVATSWLGVRSEILERRSFGEHLARACEEFLLDWLGWVMPEDSRG